MVRLNAAQVQSRQLEAFRLAAAGRESADPEVLARSFGLPLATIRFELRSLGVKEHG